MNGTVEHFGDSDCKRWTSFWLTLGLAFADLTKVRIVTAFPFHMSCGLLLVSLSYP